MSMVSVEISQEALDRAEKILSHIPHGAEKAARAALKRGLSKTRAEAMRRVKQVYTVKSGPLSENTNIRIKNPSGSGEIIGYIHFNGTKIPLYKFSVTPKTPGSRTGVFATVKRGEGGPLNSAFIAGMSNDHTGVFERNGEQGIKSRLAEYQKHRTKHTEKIEEKMGLAAAQMVGNEKIIEPLSEEVQKTVNERLEHEIERILNGYGG